MVGEIVVYTLLICVCTGILCSQKELFDELHDSMMEKDMPKKQVRRLFTHPMACQRCMEIKDDVDIYSHYCPECHAEMEAHLERIKNQPPRIVSRWDNVYAKGDLK